MSGAGSQGCPPQCLNRITHSPGGRRANCHLMRFGAPRDAPNPPSESLKYLKCQNEPSLRCITSSLVVAREEWLYCARRSCRGNPQIGAVSRPAASLGGMERRQERLALNERLPASGSSLSLVNHSTPAPPTTQIRLEPPKPAAPAPDSMSIGIWPEAEQRR